jgi:hypothetical protein
MTNPAIQLKSATGVMKYWQAGRWVREEMMHMMKMLKM